MKQFWLSVLLFSFWADVAISQIHPFTQVSLNEGLPQSVVYSIFQDSKGYLWFGTQDGVGKFNGLQFKNYSIAEGLIDNMIRNIAEDNLGNIWIATDNGISIISAENADSVFQFEPFKNKRIRAISVSSDGSIWVGETDNGVFQIIDFKITQKFDVNTGLISDRIYAIAFDDSNNVFVGTDEGLSIIKNGTILNFTEKTGLINNRIRAIRKLSDNRIWLSGYGGGITEYKDGKFKKYQLKEGIPSIKINDIIQLKDGTVALATDGDGVVFVSKKNTLTLNASNGLENNSIQSLFEDHEHNLWIGTWGSGAFKLRYFNIVQYDKDSGLTEDNAISVTVDQNNALWVGTNNTGIVRLKGKERIYFNTSNSSLPNNRIFDLKTDRQNRVIAATDRGLVRFKDNKIDNGFIGTKLNKLTIRTISVDENNRIWAGAFGQGIFILTDHSIQKISRDEGLLNDSVFAISHRKNGETWIGSDGGISILKEDKVIRYITNKNGLRDNRVSNLLEDSKNRMWVGYLKSGISVFEKDTVLHFDVTNGLSNNLSTFLAEDDSGFVWVGTRSGVNRFMGHQIRHYTTMNGLISNETNIHGAVYRSGILTIGTVAGVTQINLSGETPEESSPPVYVTKISNLDNELNRKWLNSLSIDQNSLKFEFIGISFSNPKQLRYSYRLVGFNNDWRTTNENSIQFTNLPVGKYTFEVRAENVFGVFSSHPARVHFEIIPPFTQTLLFRVLVVIFTLLAVFLIAQYRHRNLVKMNENLERVVKQRTDELLKSEELYRQIFESAGDIVAVCNKKIEIIYANPSFGEVLGYHPDELQKKSFQILTVPDDFKLIQQATKQLSQNLNGNTSLEIRFHHKNQSDITFLTTITSVLDAKTKGLQFILIGHDISTRKQVEEELIQSKKQAEQANLAKSQFLASMSHELRTPLNAILGFAQILSGTTDLQSKYLEYIKIMQKSGEHLLSMINDILDLSKIEAGRMEVVPMVSSFSDFMIDLENMMKMQAKTNQLVLKFERETPLPDFIELDFNKLRQILINLIGNAIKYVEKGTIEVYVRSINESELQFIVSDTGPGIAADQLDKIFDAFHQANKNNISMGTGLGLTISMKLAHLMGGKLNVKSEVGVGSEFSLRLPYKNILSETAPNLGVPKLLIKYLKKNDQNKKIMVVDDVDENRIILTEFLTQVGFECYGFSLATTALSELDEIKPDIILTDIIMPEMDGKEFLAEIRKRPEYKTLPMIAVTASIFSETRSQLIHLGFDEFISKPIDMNLLLDTVSNLTNTSFAEKETNRLDSDLIHDETQLKNELKSLDPALRKDFLNSLELLDEELLAQIVNSLPEHLILKKIVQSALAEKNYRIILNLNDQLNPIK